MAHVYEFLAMGGHARFVWPAYAVALIVIGGLAVQSARSLKALKREVEALEEGGRGRRGRARTGRGTDDPA